MLVGLLAKNAILIVEFALQRRALGFTIAEAAYDAARARLRPILMTSFAFVIGLMPLVVATGVGAEGNKSIGSGAVGGVDRKSTRLNSSHVASSYAVSCLITK